MTIFLLNSGCAEFEIERIVESIQTSYPEVVIQKIVTRPFDISPIGLEDILIICFSSKHLPGQDRAIAEQYVKKYGQAAVTIPVAFGKDSYIDDPYLSGIKSQLISEDKWLKNLTNRVGAFLGLRCLPKDYQIFISYRKTDGDQLSKRISDYLCSLGFKIWRDENRDEDNEGNLRIGQEVQSELKGALLRSNLVLLVDTPDAPSSKWVHEEIDFAHENLIPVLPFCFRSDSQKGSNFRKLRTLNRYCQSDSTLSNLDELGREIFHLLAEVYKRKRNIPFKVAEKFKSSGYSWSEVDKIKLLFESSKKRKFASLHQLLSHCPIYDGVHDSTIHNFIRSAKNQPIRYNEKILVYDGVIYTEQEIEEILSKNPTFSASNIIILHHEQIAEFLSQ